MQHLIKPQIRVIDPAFVQDVLDFFQERRAGHLSKWLYSSPQFPGDKACGADTWAKVVHEAKNGSPYYIFKSEEAIISQALPAISNIVRGPTRLIDLGPGSADAQKSKVFPIIRQNSNNVQNYIAVDVCQKTLDAAYDTAHAEFQQIAISCRQHNFFEEAFLYGPKNIDEIAVFYGLTMFNMAIDPRVSDLPEYMLVSYLQRLKSHFISERSHLVITQDVNQDPATLKAAYMAIGEYFTPVLHLIKRELDVTGDYDPGSFNLDVDYFPETQACAICFVASRPMKFFIEGQAIQIEAGQRLYFHNAFKFSESFFCNAANKAGFDVIHTERSGSHNSVLHILKN